MRFYRYLITLLLLTFAIVVMVGVIKAILPGFLEILESGSREEIERYLTSFGTTQGMLLAFLMQFIQIVSIVLPGGPIQIAVGIIFGTMTGFIICHLGYIAANVLVFTVSRKLGNKIDEFFPIEEEKSKGNFITSSDHPGFMVFLACLVPFMPNGIVPHIAAKTNVSFLDFLIAVYLGSAPCMLLLCLVGGKLMQGKYLTAGIYGAILFGSVICLYFMRNKVVELSEKIRKKL
jgi:uncharacterized membrane protein YdjX (TVP38/TMEM64 family)